MRTSPKNIFFTPPKSPREQNAKKGCLSSLLVFGGAIIILGAIGVIAYHVAAIAVILLTLRALFHLTKKEPIDKLDCAAMTLCGVGIGMAVC